MTLFVMKPVHWNANGYLKPAGHKAKSGYPADFGYGHEEWNGSPRMQYRSDGQGIKVFHTEGLKSTCVEDHDGSIFVFMYASHDGIQQLVGIAGSATCMIDRDRRQQREDIVKNLHIDDFKEDAWEQALVRKCYKENKKKFLNQWKDEVHWIPNWICPLEQYYSPSPEGVVEISAPSITGKEIFTPMFNSYQSIDRAMAIKVMEFVPRSLRTPEWQNIFDEISGGQSAVSYDIDQLLDEDLPETERQALHQARIGQGLFRRRLLERWNNACAVTGCAVSEALRASHIKPWCESENSERLDPNNGLILSATIDALFDRGLISFEDDGAMLLSDAISSNDRSVLGLPAPLRLPLRDREKDYLALHRSKNFS
ncbi:HNH endonuclease [Azospirillum sp. Sh1]|uniref:HNH endonuclease n=1 Tax=Azospirillum sp. Sh1 TaxID=2607285 RepID=UPI0011EF6586|nr:HNH endonuclease [Azospirillum sp. Sh1]KAA0570614.1 HNH endonuclease [Azospirillum sp. Sh1]